MKTGGVGDEGDRDSYVAHVHSLRIGQIEISDCMIEVVNQSKLDVDGLIGMNVFRDWLVTLNYPEGTARLDPLPARPRNKFADTADGEYGDDLPQDRILPPDLKDWNMILRYRHDLLLPARLQASKHVHYLILDTGASMTNLSTSMANEAGKLHLSPAQIIGISGKVKKVYETDLTPLTVANLTLSPADYYAYDMTSISHNNGFEISGLLGLPTLQRLTIQIDYRDNLLKLNYDRKHDLVRF